MRHAADDARILDDTSAWQLQIVEAFGVCPFARTCREQQRLWRQVVRPASSDWQAALIAAIAARHREPEVAGQPWEVALLLCPDAPDDPVAFERILRLAAEEAARLAVPQYHVVAFHPQMTYSPETPQRLLGFWRRSPWPMAQLVHISTLHRLQAARPAVRYVDPADLAAVEALLGQSFSGDLADRIALSNWQTFQAHGDRLRQMSEKCLAMAKSG